MPSCDSFFEDFRDQGYLKTTWGLNDLERMLIRLLPFRDRTFLESLIESPAIIPSLPIIPKNKKCQIKLACQILISSPPPSPFFLLCLSVSPPSVLALASRHVLVSHEIDLSDLSLPTGGIAFAEAAAEAIASMSQSDALIHFAVSVLRESGRVREFPVGVIKHLSGALRKKLKKCEIENESADDREIDKREKNILELTQILELPNSSRLAIPLLCLLPFCLRRIIAAQFWSCWIKFPGFLEIAKDILSFDPQLVSFLIERFEKNVYPLLSGKSKLSRDVLEMIRVSPFIKRPAGAALRVI